MNSLFILFRYRPSISYKTGVLPRSLLKCHSNLSNLISLPTVKSLLRSFTKSNFLEMSPFLTNRRIRGHPAAAHIRSRDAQYGHPLFSLKAISSCRLSADIRVTNNSSHLITEVGYNGQEHHTPPPYLPAAPSSAGRQSDFRRLVILVNLDSI